MSIAYEVLISKAYAAFNARNIDEALSVMHSNVQWPNGWEGGYVSGHTEVREYWTRQWAAIDPNVVPTAIAEQHHGTVVVDVHQTVRDLQGNLLSDQVVQHIYTFRDGLIDKMEIKRG